MEKIVQVKLRRSNQIVCFSVKDIDLKCGDIVIVEAERGIDYGYIVSEPVASEIIDSSIKKAIRKATSDDLKQIEANREKEKEAYSICSEKIQQHKLKINLVEVEYSFDRSKIFFYFTADGRIDFRNIVKDLAKVFKARIEMRQIGVRDEAKFFGGFGPCGRVLCCSSFLKDFEPVTIKMAKEQGLPLNPPKISGICGRLMCCLSYEHHCYKELSKGLPKEGDRVDTPQGRGKVISINVLRRSAIVELEESRQIEIIYK